MRRFIVLLLITGTVWAQPHFDKLVLEDGTETLGKFSGVEENGFYILQQPFRYFSLQYMVL